jgi:hypothetical protein
VLDQYPPDGEWNVDYLVAMESNEYFDSLQIMSPLLIPDISSAPEGTSKPGAQLTGTLIFAQCENNQDIAALMIVDIM